MKKKIVSHNNQIGRYLSSSSAMMFLLIIPSILLYGRILNFGFTGLDDEELVVNKYSFNQHIENIPSAFMRDAFIDTKGDSFYRPVSTITFILDANLGGNSIWIYHLDNLILHAAALILLFLFLQKLGIPRLVAFYSVLLLSIHPVFTHAVCWIPARMDLLMTVLGLLSCIMFLSYIEKKNKNYAYANVLFFALAVFAKETAVILPAAYAGIYYLKRKGEKQNFLLLFISWVFIFFFYLYMRSQVIRHEAVSVMQGLSAILQNLPVIPIMAAKLIFPFRFSPMPQFEMVFTMAGIILLLSAAYNIFKSSGNSRKMKLFGLLWYILFSIPPLVFKHPSSQFGYSYLEHRAYFPIFGLSIFLIQLLADSNYKMIVAKWKYPLIGLGVFLAGIAFVNSGNYNSPLSFLSKAIELNPSCAFAMNTRGTYFDKIGDKVSAEKDFHDAIVIAPGYADPWYNKGLLFMESANFDSASFYFSRAIQLDPNYSDAYLNRAVAKMNLHNNDGAIQDFKSSIAIDGNDETVYYNLGNLYADKGMFDSAVTYYSKSIALNANNPEALNNRANVKCVLKDYHSAIADCDSALALRSNYPEAYYNKANAFFALGNLNTALTLANQAIAIAPNYADPYLLKVKILNSLGRNAEADEIAKQFTTSP
jgi:tetratricopeptide (TPR) repeat protein